ncbi:MAG TPA: LON peptidase substrate-binding domain-containing protein [Terriglobales bacterium]|nr:LON peptidase substrate-binding domain-containing protein [Terriglobales bacterium]
MDLPAIIPIFPLHNVVLFPDVPLPLHIFEPRYREMIKDAAASHELIGMTLLRGDWQDSYYDRPEIFPVGCAGRLAHVEPLPDGRSNVLLHGLCEFEIARDIYERPYRQAQIRWWNRSQQTVPAELRAALVERLGRALAVQPDSAGQRLLQDDVLPDQKLVNFFSYMLDLPVLVKQALLQEPTLAGRAKRLIDALEFSDAESAGGCGSDRPH